MAKNQNRPVDAATVANLFLKLAAKSGKQLTPMQLLKLVYLAHGWMLGTKQDALIKNRIEAWMYGPVIPDLYNQLRHYKGSPVTRTLNAPPEDVLSPPQKNVIERTYKTYEGIDGLKLSTLTHKKGTPWEITFRNEGDWSVISDDLIQDFYLKKINNSKG